MILSLRTLPPADGLPEKRCTPVSRPSRTAICTSATARRCASTSARRRSSAVSAICAWTTPTPPRRTPSMSMPFRRISAGSALTGATAFSTARTTLKRPTSYAVGLIKKGLAYVCELTPEEFSAYRGDTTHPAVSPYRDRPIEESLDLFARMTRRGFPRRQVYAAREDRSRKRQLQHARPCALPHPLHRAPPAGHEVVHLPDVRSSPTPFRTRLRASRTRSVRSNTRITARSTTGSSRTATCRPSRARSSLPVSASTIP